MTIVLDGTTGITSPQETITGGTASGVAYLNGSKVLTTGSALTFDGTNFLTTGAIYAGTGNATANVVARSNVANGGAGYSQFLFGNTSGDTRGYLSYSHATDSLLIGTVGSTKATLDSSGNFGLGVTPSAWATVLPVLQVSNASFTGYNNQAILSSNWYYNAGNKYIASTYATQYSQTSGQHIWYNAPSGTAGNAITFTQAMTLDASGNLLVGTTNSSYTAVGTRIQPNGSDPIITTTCASSTSGATTYNLYSTGAGAFRFYVDLGGTIHATSVVITAISDQRLKENVRDIDTGLSSIMALKPRRFDWKKGKGQDKKNAAGFIAQEFEDVFPECVSTSKAGADGIEYKNINHETLIPTLVKAIQEQQAIITQLQADVAALKGTA